MEYWISRNGERHGPYSEDDLRAWLVTCQVDVDDLAWREGQDDWRPLGELLDVRGAPPRPAPPPPVAAPAPVSPSLAMAPPRAPANAPPADYEVFLLAIPAVGTLLIWAWVGQMNLLQYPGDKMMLISLATVIGTAIVAAMEASKAGMTYDRNKGTYGPVAWFFLLCLLWIVCFPAYLRKRSAYGLKSRLLAGLVLALLFVGSSMVMNVMIEQAKAKARASLESAQQALDAWKP